MDYALEFEKMAREAEKKCREKGHKPKMKFFDVGHVRAVWLCDECVKEFCRKWYRKVMLSK